MLDLSTERNFLSNHEKSFLKNRNTWPFTVCDDADKTLQIFSAYRQPVASHTLNKIKAAGDNPAILEPR